jgi:nucleotide-binding universal stress UspA family protein
VFERIMVCLDGSRLAEQIIPCAMGVGLPFSSKMILFQVIPEPVVVTPGVLSVPPIPEETNAMLNETRKSVGEAKGYLEQVARQMREAGLHVDTITESGNASQRILSYAEENNIELVALSTHGRSGLGRIFVGSVSDNVLKRCCQPMLVIKPRAVEKLDTFWKHEARQQEGQMFERLLVCLDGSKLAEQILPYATQQAMRYGAKIALLFVLNPKESTHIPSTAIGLHADQVLEPLEAEREEKVVTSYLEKLAVPIEDKGVEIELVMIHGDPAQSIINYTDKNDIDLINMGTHGRSGLGRALMGSVADHVVRESGLPIMLIRPK